MDKDRLYWIGLNLVRGIGAVRFRGLLDYFGDAKTAWEASESSLRAAGLSEKITQNLIQLRAGVDLSLIQSQLEALNVTVLTWDDVAYPSRLREIDQPPPVLYLRGTLTEADEWAVAIVGTRRVTTYGRQVTEQIATNLAQNGITVISGLARGVDSIAHQAALNAGGRTISVLGSGIDRLYPPENRKLAEQMMEQGAVISDYGLGTQPEAGNFPPRNRIIAGLSLAVVVVEASRKSGALITAGFAAEQGREVFAVPGNIFAPQSQGTNQLIQQGAHPMLHPQEILEALELERVTLHREARAIIPANHLEAQILELIRHEALHVDEISVQAQIPIKEVSATLAMMELKGMVRQMGGMHYQALHEEQAEYHVGS
ncbi:MAG TPA: DNA-processing protein DprA [Anaerolineales bacterium]|nr:DNA-processing protein DprA [Anaerolineales bacterium]